MKTVTKVGTTAIFAVLASLLTWTTPAHAQGSWLPVDADPETHSPAVSNSIPMPDGTLYDASTLTEADWIAAVDELIASDVSRTVEDTPSERLYTFHIPIEDRAIPQGEFNLTIAAPV